MFVNITYVEGMTKVFANPTILGTNLRMIFFQNPLSPSPITKIEKYHTLMSTIAIEGLLSEVVAWSTFRGFSIVVAIE